MGQQLSITDAIEPGGNSLAVASNATAMMVLVSKKSSRLQRVVALGAIGQSVYRLSKDAYARYKGEHRYSVAVSSTGSGELYDEVMSWVLSELPVEDRRALLARAERNNDGARLRLFYDGSRAHTLKIEGHSVEISLDDRATPTKSEGGGIADIMEGGRQSFTSNKIYLTTDSVDGREAIVRVLESLARKAINRPPQVYFASKWGSWNSLRGHRSRSLDSVILHDGEKEELVADLKMFLDHEDEYLEFGIPWHRGYLFFGPPGTGKSSLAAALASEFKVDTYSISLPSLENDDSLQELVRSVSPRSVLILEDIDILHAARERDDKESGVTMAGLLNTLDGMSTPHGLITIMTTNNLDVLDPALIRPGRIDYRLEVSYLTDPQLTALWRRVIGDSAPELPSLGDRKITPAEVVGIFKMNVNHLENSYDALVELISTPVFTDALV